MAGWEDLGQMLGGAGGATYQRAYDEGRFRSAQTEEALQTARVKQAESIERERKNKITTEVLANPTGLFNPTEALAAQLLGAGLGEQYQQLSGGLQKQQDIRFRDRVANTDTNAEGRLRALQAIEGKPSADVQAVGANDFVNLADDLQVPQILDSANKELQQGGKPTPAMINYRFGETLTPEQRRNFQPYVRSDTIVTPGGVPTNAGFGGRGTPTAVVDPTTVAATTAANAAAKAEGTARGGQIAAAPGKIDKAETLLANVDQLLQDPAFDTVYGLSNVLDPRNYIPGTDAARASGLLKTIDAETFGLAIEQMKGLGALSNAEGQKVQQAFTEATNPNLDEVDARAAWAKVQTRMKKAVEKARQLQQTSVLPQPGAAPAEAAVEDLSTLSDEELQRIANGG